MKSETPRTDAELKLEAFFDGAGIVETVLVEFAEQLETELADARAEIERLALEIENKQYTITCASEENQQLKESLADARAEIERLKLVSQNQETVIAAQRRSAKAKNELIEQMRDALNVLVASATPSGPLWHGSAEMQIARAALSAAERGE